MCYLQRINCLVHIYLIPFLKHLCRCSLCQVFFIFIYVIININATETAYPLIIFTGAVFMQLYLLLYAIICTT